MMKNVIQQGRNDESRGKSKASQCRDACSLAEDGTHLAIGSFLCNLPSLSAGSGARGILVCAGAAMLWQGLQLFDVATTQCHFARFGGGAQAFRDFAHLKPVLSASYRFKASLSNVGQAIFRFRISGVDRGSNW
jgi:hypothetical protein